MTKTLGDHKLQPPAMPLYLQTVGSALEVVKHTDLIGFLPRACSEALGFQGLAAARTRLTAWGRSVQAGCCGAKRWRM
jgi:hypothetical protein